MANRCRDCHYYRHLNSSAGTGRKACHYLLFTNTPRNCDIDNCDKFERRKKGEKEEKDDDETSYA